MATRAKKGTAVKAEATVPTVAADQATDSTAASLPAYQEWADLGRDSVTAVIQANAALTEGLGAIGLEMLGGARVDFEAVAQTATALLGAKTLDEVIQLSSDLAKSSFEAMLGRSARLSEMSVKVANEALAPFGGGFEAAVVKLTKPIAA